jgi:hypothetical protein
VTDERAHARIGTYDSRTQFCDLRQHKRNSTDETRILIGFSLAKACQRRDFSHSANLMCKANDSAGTFCAQVWMAQS